MSVADLAQPGVLTDPTAYAEYLTFELTETPGADVLSTAMAMISNVDKSIGQKDPAADLTITVGFGAEAWGRLFPDAEAPPGLADFVERSDGGRHFPSTGGDIFLMIKSARMDLNFQAGKYLVGAFGSFARVVDDTQGFSYLDNRDMIDFVDGTENPTGDARVGAVLRMDGPYSGGSYLTVQKYLHRRTEWEAQSDETQSGVIGRTKLDDVEFPDDEKQPFAHNVKSKVTIDGVEQKMLRQNRPIGTAAEYGTMFVGFVGDPTVIETSLDQMITADADGNYDHLLDFTDAVSGANYFVPPADFLASFG